MKQSVPSNIVTGIALGSIVAVLGYALINERYRKKNIFTKSEGMAVPSSRRTIAAMLLFVLGFVPSYVLDGILGYNLSWYPFLWIFPSFIFVYISMTFDG